MSKLRDRAPFMSKSQSNGRLWLVTSWNVLITQPKWTSQHEFVLCTSAYVGHMLCWCRLIMLDVCLLSHRTTKCLRSNFLKSNVWYTYIVIPIFVQYIHLLRRSLHWSCLEVSAMQRSGVRLSVRLSLKEWINCFSWSRNVEKTQNCVYAWSSSDLEILRIRHRKATWRLKPTLRTRNFKTEEAVRMKLGRLVVLLAVYLKLQTNSEYTFPWPIYTWLNMIFYAYLPDMVSNVKGMMTLTYDLDLLQGYLWPQTKIWATNINILRPYQRG